MVVEHQFCLIHVLSYFLTYYCLPFTLISGVSGTVIDFTFASKYLLLTKPFQAVAVITIVLICVFSFFMRSIETYFDKDTILQYGDAFWMVTITFLTVGYGDITPSTVGGKILAAAIGFIGIATTAIIVAVVSNMLRLNPAQKKYSSIVRDAQLSKEREAAASDIVKYAWMTYKYEKRGDYNRAAK